MRTRLKVWIVQTGEPLIVRGDERKMRSNLLAEELAGRGHEVVLWVSGFDHNAKRWAARSEGELLSRKNMRTIVLKGTGYSRNVSLSRFVDHRLVAWRFRGRARRVEKPDVIVASLPPHDLAYQCVRYAKDNAVPVIVDVRDPWPDILLERMSGWRRRAAGVLLLKDFRMARESIAGATGVVAVSNAFLDWCMRLADRTPSKEDRVLYLGYHRPRPAARPGKRIAGVLEEVGRRKVITYVGAFSTYHDPSPVLDCAAMLAEREDDIAFVLAGDGQLRARSIQRAAGRPNVFFPGWLNGEEIDALLANSYLGVCPTTKCTEIFPNKAFMYLSMGLPVVSSFQGDLKRLIQDERVGCYCEPGNAHALARAVSRLVDDSALYEEMSANAAELFEARFTEERIYPEFATHVEGLCEGCRG